MTMRKKQELIRQVVNLLNALIEVEELPTAPPTSINEQVEMLTIKECAQQISGLSGSWFSRTSCLISERVKASAEKSLFQSQRCLNI